MSTYIKNPDYLFVYGTLLRTVNSAAIEDYPDITETLSVRKLGKVSGQLWHIDWYPAFTAGYQGEVLGEVCFLGTAKEKEKILQKLDTWENYDPNDIKNSEYVRKVSTVRLNDGEEMKAWVYHYNRSTIGLKRIYSGDWLGWVENRGE